MPHREDLCDVAFAAGDDFGDAAGDYESPFAECGGDSVPLGASADHLPADLHLVLRGRRLVPAEPLPTTSGGGPGQRDLRGEHRYDGQRAHQDHAPAVRHGTVYLTHFYLMMAAGGALGGLLVGLMAPHFLNALYEVPVSLVACAALVSYVLRQDAELKWIRRWPGVVVSVALTLTLAGFVGWQIKQMVSGSRVLVRNFYGGLKVRDTGAPGSLWATRTLTNGTINHGEEYLHMARRDLATTYYGPNTGIGIAIREKQKAGAVRIGVIGLGTGTTAAYGRLGDYIRYYEINPLVLELAKKEFFFLADCKGKLDVAMGDARLSLERELQEGHAQNFDVLAVDAFSSDSIPVHLLTKEAMQLYFRHLKPDGILALHISNRYLDLRPVVAGISRAPGHIARLVNTEEDDTQDVFGATWVLITSPAAGFTGEILSSSTVLDSKRTVRLWTDEYSNLFQILK